ncbi:50S ribosomal protein L1 [Candidatus Saganbacteria bacterium]|nr:50S ribosomal protein L1 [Candidatus Saganbacteria bacterium]
MRPSKSFKAKAQLVDRLKKYSLSEALPLLKQTARAKFDESVDLAMKLGVDPKKHAVRGTVVLPGGSGRTQKVAVIAKGPKASEAEQAGADLVGGDDLVEKIQKGYLDFDILICTPDMMPAMGKLGKVLGPKGLMPNPKSGTVALDVAQAVKEFKGGKTEFKMDKNGALHMVIGKISFAADALEKNFSAALAAILQAKPSGIKGVFIQSIILSSTMGPGIKLDPKIAQDSREAE